MTIGSYCGEVSVTCDGCEEELTESDLDVEGFQELLEAIRQDGWLIVRGPGGWEHFCPDCRDSP